MTNEASSEEPLIEKAIDLLNQRYERFSDFNANLDTDEPIEVGAARYERSKVLYWVDRNAYHADRAAWEGNVREAKHEKALGVLRDNGFEARFADLVQAAARDRVVPFVGAGLSKAAGMPLWVEALQQLLARQRQIGADVALIEQELAAGRLLEAAQALADRDRVQISHFIRTTYRAQQLRLSGPVLLLPQFARGCVVTTNFDDAIEKAYEAKRLEFKHYMHGTQEHNFFGRMVRGDRCILKLHGDAENDVTHILTKTQYETAYGNPFDFTKPLPKALRQLYVSQSLLFLGCSLEQDWTIDLFRNAKEGDGYQVPQHYALLPAPAHAPLKQRKETSLLALNIQPLWYPDGEHDLVEKLLDLLVDAASGRYPFKF